MARTIRLAIAGVGSCASSLVQALEAVRTGALPDDGAGVMHPDIDGFRVGHVEVVCAFDVTCQKVGADLGQAIFAAPNAATVFYPVERMGLPVTAGPLEDGLGAALTAMLDVHPSAETATFADVVAELQASRADVLLCFLPTGARAAVRGYARAAADAGVAFVNATPECVANDPELAGYFERRGVPLLGDDTRSQMGATALHVDLIELCRSRAMEITNTYQLNIGGNADFCNLAETQRSASKRVSKLSALSAAGIDTEGVAAGPSGYVPFLKDSKVAYIHLAGNLLLGMKVSIEVKLQVEDSPNAAGVALDMIRVAAGARARGERGVIDDVCPFLFKRPRVGATESEGRRLFAEYLEQAGGEALTFPLPDLPYPQAALR